ncbi:MAG: type II toxin-antitoxin system VapC family toxin [Nitrospirota bacterium]|nr:type II toxin-antitoxin system VapC family toxin [Nitrospirota bacterium]
MFLLDTNTCIRLLNRTHPNILKRYRRASPSEISVCSIVKAELLYGARHSKAVETNLRRLSLFFSPLSSLSFDDRCAEEYGQIRADLSVQGKLIGPNDLMIGAIARAHDAILVTHNVGEFSRVTGLRIEDWEVL